MSARIPFFNIESEIISNTKIAPHHFKTTLLAPQIAHTAKPGQFINIRISDGYEPLLRRPFSICRVRNQIEILYKVAGKGTDLLSKKSPGDKLDILGPLGNGFIYPLSAKRYPLLIGGGVGIAPLLFLAERLAYSIERIAYSEKLSAIRYPLNAKVLIGAKTENEILCEKEFKRLGCEVRIASDDGSKGFKGKVTDLLKHLLSIIHYPLSAIYACGPSPMLKEISRISKEHNIPAQVSLEAHMACGVGICLGCVAKTKQGYKRVCNEGPVFNIKDIVWE